MSNLVQNPFPIFTDADGDPLEDGYIYIGIAGLNPLSNPLQAYWDPLLTVPANSIRTKGGYPATNGTPGRLYTEVNYSILVQDKNQVTVYSQLNAIDYIGTLTTTTVSSVDTIADLRGVIPASANTQISVGGSVTVGDGLMAPLYYWDPLSSATDNGVSIIQPTLATGNGRWLWLNTNAPTETVNISATSTLTLGHINKLFLVNASLAATLTVPDGDFQGQFLTLANRGSTVVTISGTGIPSNTTINDEIYLRWVGTQWSISYGVSRWKRFYSAAAATAGQWFDVLSTWVPTIGKTLACHGQLDTPQATILGIYRPNATTISIRYIDLAAAWPTLSTRTATQGSGTVLSSIDIMSNFDEV